MPAGFVVGGRAVASSDRNRLVACSQLDRPSIVALPPCGPNRLAVGRRGEKNAILRWSFAEGGRQS